VAYPYGVGVAKSAVSIHAGWRPRQRLRYRYRELFRLVVAFLFQEVCREGDGLSGPFSGPLFSSLQNGSFARFQSVRGNETENVWQF
jgi:hypothetical protein